MIIDDMNKPLHTGWQMIFPLPVVSSIVLDIGFCNQKKEVLMAACDTYKYAI